MKQRLHFCAGFLCIVLLILAACTPAGKTPEPVTLNILYTGNVNGELERCGCAEKQLGGVARRKTIIDRLREEPALLVDAGDLLFGSFVDRAGSRGFYRSKSGAMIASMNRMGYDAVTPGDYDFAEGKEFLLERIAEASFPVVCANLVGPDGRPVVAPYRVVTKGKLRVALVGFLDSHVVTDRYREALGPLQIEDPFESARRLLPEIEKQSDVIVALIHFNIVDVTKFLTAHPAIGVAIQGHVTGDGQPVQVARSLVVAGGVLGKEIGHLRVTLDGQRRITGYNGSLIPILEETVQHPDVREVVARFNQTVETERFSDAVRFYEDEGSGEVYAGADVCAPCHPSNHQGWLQTPHAFAMPTLFDGGYGHNPECVICHVVGYREPNGYVSAEKTPHLQNVQCESCHGSAEKHLRGEPMKSGVPEEVCIECHDDVHSPTFDYPVFLQRATPCLIR